MVEFKQIEHQVLQAAAGVNLTVKEYIYDSGKSGKQVYIQSGLHGGETSQWVLYKLHDYLMNNLVKGVVRVVLFANPAAWMQRFYNTTAGKFSLIDGKDYNRGFAEQTGYDEKGLLAKAIMQIAQNCDLAIDLHTAKKSNPFVIYTQRKYENLVKVCGFDYNQYSDDAHTAGLENTFNAALDRKNIANLCIECGSHDEYDEAKIGKVYDALLRLLGFMENVCEQKMTSKPCFVFTHITKLWAPCGGLFRLTKNIGDKVNSGEAVGEIYRADNVAKIVKIKSNCNGLILKAINTHVVWQGDIVLELADDLQEL